MGVEFWVCPPFSLRVLGSLWDVLAGESVGSQTHRGVVFSTCTADRCDLFLSFELG